jgi:inosose dehydratase
VVTESQRSIAVGTASVNWGFDPLYTWVRQPTFTRMLDEMAQSGYGGTEISYNFPDDALVLRMELERRGLRAAGSFHALDVREATNHDDALRAVLPVADRLQALASDVLILSDAPSPARLAVAGRVASDGSDGLSDSGWQAMGRGLNRIGEWLAGRGMRAVFHPHVGTYVETRSEIDRLCEVTDPALVGLCPDTGHLAYAGVNPEDIFADYADRIGYVHLKDLDGEKLARARKERVGFVRAVEMGLFVELGTGMVVMPRIIDPLKRAGYQGWVIVEQDAPRDPLGAAMKNRAFLREVFGL